jgi:hypothetical protein
MALTISKAKLVRVSSPAHNTSARVLVTEGYPLSSGQWDRLRRKLCGRADCLCGRFVPESGWLWTVDAFGRTVLATKPHPSVDLARDMARCP